MDIKKITILGGYGRNGIKELVDQFDLKMGDLLSIVGPTGSGKTALINDIGLFADEDTPSRRRILINNAAPSEEFLDESAKNPIALITQHTVGRESPMSRAIAVIVCFCTECRLRIS